MADPPDTRSPDFGGIFDEFQDLFGDLLPGLGRYARRGADLRTAVELTFLDAAEGCTVDVSIERHVTCDECRGSGDAPGTVSGPCRTCDGRGVVHSQSGAFRVSSTCATCGGRGRVGRRCHACNGAGLCPRIETLAVTVPAGVASGQLLRLSGKGHDGPTGTPAGDLYVEVQAAAHPRLRRSGADLHIDIDLDPASAAAGCDVSVPLVRGERSVRVPPGAKDGQEIVIRGHGLQIVGAPPTPPPSSDDPYREADTTGRRGNLIARLCVAEPTARRPGIFAWLRARFR